MIFVITTSGLYKPEVLVAQDKDDLILKIRSIHESSNDGTTPWEAVTIEEWMSRHCVSSLDEMIDECGYEKDFVDSLRDLPKDQMLWTTVDQDLSLEKPEIEEVDAWLDWLGHDVSWMRTYWSFEEAEKAVADDSEWRCHQGDKAREALERALSEWRDFR